MGSWSEEDIADVVFSSAAPNTGAVGDSAAVAAAATDKAAPAAVPQVLPLPGGGAGPYSHHKALVHIFTAAVAVPQALALACSGLLLLMKPLVSAFAGLGVRWFRRSLVSSFAGFGFRWFRRSLVSAFAALCTYLQKLRR